MKVLAGDTKDLQGIVRNGVGVFYRLVMAPRTARRLSSRSAAKTYSKSQPDSHFDENPPGGPETRVSSATADRSRPEKSDPYLIVRGVSPVRGASVDETAR